MDNRPASEVSAAGLFRMRFPSHELLIPFTKMSSGVRQAMTTRNIPHSFQSVLTSHHESVTALTATVQSGQARGKCLAVGVAEKNCLVKNMNQDLEYRQPDTIVITSVDTLKTAFHQWTEEQERKRFAKELHDGLGPLLSVIKMLVSGMDEKNSNEVNGKIKQNLRLAVDEAIANVRNVSANISPHLLNNFGLKDSIEAFIKRMGQAEHFHIQFTTNLEKQRFNYNVEVIVYRVICELINNTLKHAAATEVTISLQLENEVLYLEYTDNGVGFDVASVGRFGGMGLDNMRYRLQSGNGNIEITSEHGHGMRANAYIHI